MNITALRKLLRPVVGSLKDRCTGTNMPDFCERLGLQVPPEGDSKRERMYASIDALDDQSIPVCARNLIDSGFLNPNVRNQVQDFLWEDEPEIVVSKRHRRELARALQTLDLFQHWENFSQLLKDIFIIPDDVVSLIFNSEKGILEYIYQHFVRNPEDANIEDLFEKLQVFDLTAQRFRRFLEGLTSADVQIDIKSQLTIVTAMNTVLINCGAELRQISEIDGYPVFGLASIHSVHGKPKNIIFASFSKPDIRISSALDNNIEILSDTSKVLVYDKPLSIDGLRWTDLQNWWAELTQEHDSDQAKATLYRRLRKSLPPSSPPQLLLFDSFFSGFGPMVPDLPVLLPEVWLHWDAKTVAERGAQALLNHRMDFLMLLPGGVRMVIEVDGSQHYADDSGRANPVKYAKLVKGDRELKLAGYDVYRFGGSELQGDDAPKMVRAFFVAVLKRYGVVIN